MNRKISQREARKLRADNNRLNNVLWNMKRGWGKSWPQSVACIHAWKPDEKSMAIISTAITMRHAVMVSADNTNIYFHAVEIPKP